MSLAQNLDTPESLRVASEGSGDVEISGELKQWHKTTLTLDGPQASENGSINPFMDYRMNVTFTHPATGTTYTVPGDFAADGDAANTGATRSNKWRAHLSADFDGQWNYSISFRTGNNVAVNDSPTGGLALDPFNGLTGSFTIGNYNKGTFSSEAESIKSWSAHQQDWNAGDPSWDGGRGTELIGALNYLASEDLNSVSFLTMNIIGDDKNVFPYTDYNERERMGVSRLDQWEIVFGHGTEKGLHLHFKTQETENDQLLDGGELGPERKLY